MATITNHEARLLWGPKIPGHSTVQWLPGKNPLDARYWGAAQKNSDVRRWLKLGWLTVDPSEDMPDPTVPPSDEELAEFTRKELGAALKNRNVPVQWHPALEAELVRRDAAETPPAPPAAPAPAPSRKSLSGLRVDDALPLIAAESDIDTLEAWADADKRKSIDEAIDARMTELALDGDEG